MYNVAQDISTLTTIPKNSIDKIMSIMEGCICQNVEEQLSKGEPLTEVNIGIGVLSILLEDDTIKYKFTPTKGFNSKVKTTIKTKRNPIEISLEEGLVKRILHAYKDIL